MFFSHVLVGISGSKTREILTLRRVPGRFRWPCQRNVQTLRIQRACQHRQWAGEARVPVIVGSVGMPGDL